MGLAKTKEKMFDRRTAERYIAKGLATRADYEAYLRGLKDVSDKAEVIPMEAILGVDGSELGKRKYIPAYSHRKVRDYTGISFEEDYEEGMDQAEYGIEEDELSTRTADELDEDE